MKKNLNIIILLIIIIATFTFFAGCKKAEPTKEDLMVAPIAELIKTYENDEYVKGVQPDWPEGVAFPKITSASDFRVDFSEENDVYLATIDLDEENEKVLVVMLQELTGENETNFYVVVGLGFSDE